MEDRIMVKLLNRHSFLLILLIMVSFMSSSMGMRQRGRRGGGDNTRINGTVLEVISVVLVSRSPSLTAMIKD
jgi:hypothetical protein